jgi:hypothetical protein
MRFCVGTDTVVYGDWSSPLQVTVEMGGGDVTAFSSVNAFKAWASDGSIAASTAENPYNLSFVAASEPVKMEENYTSIVYGLASAATARYVNLDLSNCAVSTTTEISGIAVLGESSTTSGAEFVTGIKYPEGITHFYWDAFQGFSSLKTLDIPSTVTGIDDSALSPLTNLSDLTVRAITLPDVVPVVTGETSSSLGKTGLVIYVPSEAVTTYSASTLWAPTGTETNRITAIVE